MNAPPKPNIPLVVAGVGLFLLWVLGAYSRGRDPLLILLEVVGMVLGVGLLRVFVTARSKHTAWGWNVVIILGSCVTVVALASLSRTDISGAARLAGYALGYALIPSVGLATMYYGLYPRPRVSQIPTVGAPRQ